MNNMTTLQIDNGRLLFSVAMLIACVSAASAQNIAGTASLEGTVREDNGSPVKYALVTATSTSTASARGYSGTVPTTPAGVFRFPNLPAGSYRICARVPLMTYSSTAGHFTDSCLWPDTTTPHIAIAQGQVRTGAVVTLSRGHFVRVRINDPGKLLSPPSGKHGGNALALHMAGPSGARFIPITNLDAGGRDHSVVIPYNTSHKLAIQSDSLLLKDERGQALSSSTSITVNAMSGAVPTSIVVNVVGRLKP